MYEILNREKIAENTYSLKVKAPKIAKKAKAGQFFILQIDEYGERIPLTIADYDSESITCIFLEIGHTTKLLKKLNKGDKIQDVAGPLGNPTEVEEFGTVCVVGGGLGIAALHPIARSLKKKGNEVISILGAKSENHLFWLEKFEKNSDGLVICTDDGSLGRKGFVTEALRDILRIKHVNRVITVGPGVMMKAISDLTRQRVKTIASLNPIIVDGIGMCGSCRVSVDKKIKFACVDGPEFDAHLIDWNEFLMRNNRFSEQENHICRIR
ncbi:MAG: sulfide/dihydroorotate dehydrogenase-like FAD/NAD-binding protein [bacterium]